MSRKTKQKIAIESDEAQGFNLSPDTKGAIITILVFLVAFLCILSLFNLAGPAGNYLGFGLGYLFGWADWLFIVVLLVVGYFLIKSHTYRVKWSSYLGLFLVILAVTGLSNFLVSDFTFQEITSAGDGGGALGWAIGYGLDRGLGFWGALLVLLAVFLIGFFLAFNTSFRDINERAKALGLLKEKILPASDEQPDPEEEEEFLPDEILLGQTASEETITEEKDASSGVPEEPDAQLAPKKTVRKKIIVPIDLLTFSNTKPDSGDIQSNMQKIKKTFENFGIEVTMGEVSVGPTVTQYTLRPAEGVRLAQVLTLQNDLALALAAHPIRMEAPIPGKSLVGIEVPNQSISTVKLRDVLESSVYAKRKSNLYIALGKDVAGSAIMANLVNMPHLLIAGATGSGKSICINNIILSLIYQNSPDDLKFILIDPKRVELSAYNDVPHLLTPVINDTDKIINALRWVVKEMHERYKLLQAANKRNIDSYNKAVIVNRLPYIVVIVDEFAALMSLAAKEVEAAVVSLAQLGRAAGIHLILATQRPSVDVITGLIKANITSRIAFAVASAMDSRTIIDTSGADKLLGKGDMLFMTAESSKVKRIQGAYVTDEEINDVVNYLKTQAEPEYNSSVTDKVGGVSIVGGNDGYEDSLTEAAKEEVIKAGKASATLLQRRLRVGYARAARLLDILEQMGVVGPDRGSKPREVLVNQADLEENFSSALDINETGSNADEELDNELGEEIEEKNKEELS
ncbi:MAG: DNA translocase FtsK 4TM domain-containing protein [Patescibacteria group bacterium]